MIYNLLNQILVTLSSGCVPKGYILILVISTFLNSLICILLIPVTIRLAGQLISQVFKYRYIVNNCIRGCEHDENRVITAYYQHFQIFTGIVLCMFGFCVFNTISLIYTSVFFFGQDWENDKLMGYLAGAIAQSCQEGIVLFGVTLLLQIANYFKGKKVQLNILVLFIIARMGYVFCLEFSQYYIRFVDLTLVYQKFPSVSAGYLKKIDENLIVIVYGIDIIARVFTVCAFMRMCIIIVHQRIIEFITHLHTSFLEWERYADKIRAYKLMKVAAWGTYSLTLLNAIASLSGAVVYFIIELNVVNNILPIDSYQDMVYFTLAILIFTSILSILPSILYSIFLVAAWLVFRDRTKVKYSGFRTSDVTREQLLPDKPIFTNQDHLHQTFYKNKNKIHRASYVILIISASVCFSVFLTPLMIKHSRENVVLTAGEYYMLDDVNLNECALVDYQSLQQSCSTNLKGLISHKPLKQSFTTQYKMSRHSLWSRWFETWIPKNSTVSQYCYSSHNGTENENVENELNAELYFPSETPYYGIICQSSIIKLVLNSSQGTYDIETSGMYRFALSNVTNFCNLNLTRSIDLIRDKIPFSHFTHTNLADLDAIIYEPTKVLYHDANNFCQFSIVCYYNPVWPIIFCIAVFLITLFIQVSLLYCIHRI